MHVRLIAFGVALAMVGAVLLATMLRGAAGDRNESLGPVGSQPAEVSENTPSLLLPIGAGLCLAAGAGLIGIGANRWYARRERDTRG
jgi:hypothetical protein